MRAALDPVDHAVAMAFHGRAPAAKMIGDALERDAGGLPVNVAARRERVATLIYSFDQEALERPWSALSAVGKQTYYDIAEAVIVEARR